MFGNKPTFGTNTGFGAGTFGNTGTPFGQGTSTFGANKPLGTSFGGTQPFGTTQPAGSSLFGGGVATSTASSIFGGGAGTSTFGQTAAAPSTGFGGFGATAGTSGMFGANNQQNTATGLFSNTSASAFGAPKPTFGSFGGSPSTGTLFGQTAAQTTQQQQPGMMYNQGTSTGTSLFGGSVFGAGTSTATVGNIGATSGTTVKFVPVTGTDTMMKNSITTSINTRHMCITVMKEYENKSLEVKDNENECFRARKNEDIEANEIVSEDLDAKVAVNKNFKAFENINGSHQVKENENVSLEAKVNKNERLEAKFCQNVNHEAKGNKSKSRKAKRNKKEKIEAKFNKNLSNRAKRIENEVLESKDERNSLKMRNKDNFLEVDRKDRVRLDAKLGIESIELKGIEKSLEVNGKENKSLETKDIENGTLETKDIENETCETKSFLATGKANRSLDTTSIEKSLVENGREKKSLGTKDMVNEGLETKSFEADCIESEDLETKVEVPQRNETKDGNDKKIGELKNELQMEDYAANRKGPQSSAVMGFGTTNQPSLFTGGATSTPGATTFFGQNQNKSLFGATNTGFGTATTGMFGQQQQQNVSPFGAKPLGFGTPATTQTSTFNFGNSTTFGTANQPNKSLFGQTAVPTGSSTIFGTSAQTQPTTAFGSTFGGGFGTQNQTQSSLFAKPLGFGAATTTAAAAATPFSFGQNTTTNTGSFAFNQKPTTTGFGTTGFGTGTTGFTGFGAAANTNTNLFGQAKPQLGFGNTGFGTGLNMGGSSFFGNTANKPGGLNLGSGFGGATNTGFGAGTGLTGGTSNFSFGSTTMPNFGSDQMSHLSQQPSTAQQQLLALASSPYGDSPLFRNIIQDPEKKEEILKPTNPQAQRAFTSASHYKITLRPTVKVKLKPISALNSSRSSLFDGVDEDESEPVNDSFLPRRSVKKLVLKCRPQNSSRVSISLNESSLSQNQRETTQPPLVREVRSLSPLLSPIFGPPDRKDRVSPADRPSPSFEISAAAKSRGSASALDSVPISRGQNLDDSIAILNFNRARKDLLSPDPDLDDSVSNDEGNNFVSIEQEPHPARIVLRRPGYYTIPSLEELANMVDEDENCFVENFTIGREGYGNVFFPGITNLAKLNLDEIVHFRRKEVTIYPNDEMKPSVGQGLNKKAQITLDCVWPNDKTTHSPIKSIERLKFLNYQDKLEKVTARLAAKFIEYRPETGSWVFQVNHFSKYGLEDSDDEDLPNGGSQVLHATPPPKELLLQQQHLKQLSNGGAQISPKKLQHNGTNGNSLAALHRFEATSVPLRLRDDEQDEEMEGILQQTFPDEMLQSDEPFRSVSHRFAKAIGTNSNRVQSMKASFFFDESEGEQDDDDAEFTFEDKLDKRAVAESFPHGPVTIMDEEDSSNQDLFNHSALLLEPSQRMRFQPSSTDQDVVRKQKIPKLMGSMNRVPTTLQTRADVFSKLKLVSGCGMSPEKLPKVTSKHQELLPLEKSVFAGKNHLIADAACFMGRSFRVGWGPNLTLVHPGTPLETSSTQLKLFQPFIVPLVNEESNMIVKRVPFGVTIALVTTALDSSREKDDVAVSHVRESLELQLKLTQIGLQSDCSLAIPVSGVSLIHKHAELAARHANETSSGHSDVAILQQGKAVWELAVALWGNLSKQMRDCGDGDCDTLDAYELHMARREALSDWLASTSAKIISDEVERHERNATQGPLLSVFSHLTGLQITDASRAARKCRDFSLSVLVSQAGGNCEVRDMVRRQLDHWEETKADRFIRHDRMKVYALLSGCLVWPSSESAINTCEGLDWRRAFALHLWYHCLPMASIGDVLSEYELAYQGLTHYGSYANPPHPPYLENGTELLDTEANHSSVWDTCYHLLKLYCDRTHRLDVLLTPTTSTPDPLDHRLSWLLFQALLALDYDHLPAIQRSNLNSNFASQLITMGLWHWAIFVLMHIEENSLRKLAILDVLRRHILTTNDSADRETFLIERLLIPKDWIYDAKAIQARKNGNIHAEAYFLLKSGSWNQSHKLIVQHIAPDAIINENYDYLKGLLEELVPSDRSGTVLDWAIGGQVFIDYIHLSQTVNRIIKGELSAYELEGLQPEVTNLCSRVGNIQCRSAKDRLCVSEMAKKTANLLRAVLSLGSGMTTIPSSLVMPQLTKLPLPEDYGMQEFKAVVQSYFLEMT